MASFARAIAGRVLKKLAPKSKFKKSAVIRKTKRKFFKPSLLKTLNKSRRSRTKHRGDADGNQVVQTSHGRNYGRLNPKMESKIRSALNANFQEIYQNSSTIFQTQYGAKIAEVFELNRTPHIDNFMSSGGQSNTGAVINKAGHINLANSEMEISLTNMANTTCLMKVYEYIYRRDLPAKLWDGTAYQNADTKYVVDNGPNFYNNTGGGATPTYATYGQRLFDNPLFTSYCKIIGVKDYELAPGKNFLLKMQDKKDHRINTLLWDQTDTSAEGGITRGYVVEFRSSAVATATKTASSSGQVRVEAIVIWRYQFDQAWNGGSKINYYDGLSHPTGVTMNVMNQNIGAVTGEDLA